MIQAQNQKIVALVASVNKTTGALTASATLDTVGYDYVSVLCNLGPYTTVSMTTNPVVDIKHSDTTDATNYATVVADSNSDGSVARQYVYHFDRRSALRRYLKVTLTNGATGTDCAMAVGATVLLGRPELAPSSTSAMTGSTNDSVTIL